MRFEIYEIEDNKKYQFIIGTRERPDSDLKDGIRDKIREAMGSLGKEEDRYSVSIVQTETAEEEERDIPDLWIDREYLIFALLFSGNNGEPSEEELEEQKEEIAQGINKPEDSRISLVLLHDCTVRAIVTAEYANPGSISYIG